MNSQKSAGGVEKKGTLYSSVKKELERLVDGILAPVENDHGQDVEMPYDLYVQGENIVVEIEMPGLEKERIRIEGHDRILEISGEKNTVKKKYKNCIALERENGAFHKIIYLEHSVNMKSGWAEVTRGVLKVSFPIVEEKRGKTVIKLR